MVEAESRFNYQHETPKQPGENPEFERFSERRPFQILEDPVKKDQRINKLLSEARNLLSLTIVIPNVVLEKKPEPPKQKKLTVWDLLLLIMETIVEGAIDLLSSGGGKKG